MNALLAAESLDAFYGDFQALFDVDFVVQPGEIVAIVGANGAGKSTFLKCCAGLISTAQNGLRWRDAPIGGRAAAARVRDGIALVPEGRQLFPSLSVEENLLVGNYAGVRHAPWTLARIYDAFPILEERRRSAVSVLSGGQQQMVAIGRALMSNPLLLLCDEISLGLAPRVVEDIYRMIPQIRGEGTAILIVEQDISRALAASDRFYCLQEGRIRLTGRAEDVSREAITAAYFGT